MNSVNMRHYRKIGMRKEIEGTSDSCHCSISWASWQQLFPASSFFRQSQNQSYETFSKIPTPTSPALWGSSSKLLCSWSSTILFVHAALEVTDGFIRYLGFFGVLFFSFFLSFASFYYKTYTANFNKLYWNIWFGFSFPRQTLKKTILGTMNKTFKGDILGLIWLHLCPWAQLMKNRILVISVM